MDHARAAGYPLSYLPRDLTSGLVVFLVALPLCLGIALASGAPLFSGLLAGIVGGLVVGSISGSSTSVSGPAAGLTAIVIAQIASLGSFQAFLLAVMVGGVIQIILGIVRAGSLSAFFPSSVIKGLLAAIGVILILKQIPHVLGHDTDPEGEMSFTQPDKQNTFTEILTVFEGDIHLGAAAVGLISIVLLAAWGRVKLLKNSVIPGPLVVVLLGVCLHLLFQRLGGPWVIQTSHLVQIPVAETAKDFLTFLTLPDFSQWANPGIYLAGATIAIVASLETLLNLEAVDKLDPENRNSPASRELVAQGVGNMVSGFIGGLPVTSVIVRGSVNVNSGGKTKVSTIFHGLLLLISVALIPVYMNMIPLAALAAILLVTGFKLASPSLFRQMWAEGRYQFLPFLITLLSIVFTDLLTGILIGLGVSLLFILNSSLRQPIRRIMETHVGGNVLHIELANQVSFLNRAALDQVLNEAEQGSNLLIDASHTDYIDPDILSLIQEFKTKIGPARGISVSLRGFRRKYHLNDEIQFADYSTRDLKDRITAEQVLKILRDGNERFYTDNRLSRDLGHQVNATAGEQHPLAVVLSCIDSRVPAELVLDLGIGDILSVRVAGNVIGNKSLGSIEYGVLVAGVKLVLVLGHTRCGAVSSTVHLMCDHSDPTQVTGCAHLDSIVHEVDPCVDEEACEHLNEMNPEDQELFIDEVARRNVYRSVHEITARSPEIRELVQSGKVMVVGALYDVKSGKMEFLTEEHGTIAADTATDSMS
ncbi:Carbonic anhydrase 2 [Gimesia panareensis]|uniref:Carbonic anhydrase 2 n=1 Tax=Gimesia panareensis TaxID=2527978 RepID=A0A518FUF8_9PLAN|nr:SulP family inorganic anion transporter [Gimesia panareensis]QDV19970.1 Carbonic anhydrase 2 [Gimesia panareensis]